VLTGLINSKINTLEVKTVKVIGLLSCYVTVLSTIARVNVSEEWKVI
jgi:hypothetical protein